MKVRNIALALIILTAVFLSFNSASAHDPSSLNLSYDLSSQTLSVSVGHYTYDKTIDYIDSVEVKINGKPYNIYNYTSQYTKTMASFSYKIEARTGDLIEVTATSKTGGSKTSSITVGS
jgi:ribosomal protein S17